MALTSEQISAIERLLEDATTMTRLELVNKYNSSRVSIAGFVSVMRLIGVEVGVKPAGVISVAELNTLLNAGLTHAQIASHFGIKTQSVSVRISRHGLSKKRPQKPAVDIDTLLNRVKAAE